MATLEKRIALLEQATPTDMEPPMFVHFVGLGTEASQIERITKGNQSWERQPGESEDALKKRAMRETPPPPPRCRTVFTCW